jgi:predicted carbohydrate-binding protein with CBM5 and CBM33 domain
MNKLDWDRYPNILRLYNRFIKELPKEWVFVYKISELDTGKFYYGIKNFFYIEKKKPLKGKVNRRHVKKETDWRTYNTSSKLMQEKLEANRSNYEKEIIRLCSTQTELKAWEAYLQLNEYVNGKWFNCYNEVINLRLRVRK